jgi:hypothetical protein
MKYKTIAALAAILSFINGSFFLLAPVFSMSLLGRDTNLTGIMNTRISGGCAIGLAVIVWLAKDIKYPEVRRLITYGMLTTFCLLVVIDIHGVVIGAVNNLGWLFFFGDLFLLLGFVLSIFTDGGWHH